MKKLLQVPATKITDILDYGEVLSKKKNLELVIEFNRRYYHWEEVRYRVDDDIAVPLWTAMKAFRRQSSRSIIIGKYQFSFSSLPEFEKILHEMDRITPEGSGFRGRDAEFNINAMMEEAIASSQMEGSTVSRKDGKMILRNGRSPKNNGERMVFNSYRAMESIGDMLDRDMSAQLILEMHRMITSDTLSEGKEWEGRFREDDETVVGSGIDPDAVYRVPPKHGDIPELIDELCTFANSDGEFIHPVIKAIMIHFLIGNIHPFVDGNGRLARIMFYWYVMKKGYDIMEYASISRMLNASRSKYHLSYQYTETDDNDMTYFIRFNLGCIHRSIAELMKYVQRKNHETDAAMDVTGKDGNISITEALILSDYGRSGSTFTVRGISTRFQVSLPTARAYVNNLCSRGYATAVGKDGKTVLYAIVK